MPGSKSSEFPRGNPWTRMRPGWGLSGERRRTSGNSRIFVVLETNHYDELASDSVFGRNAQRQIESHQTDVFISVVSVQESVQGWMALINRKRPGHEQVHAYARFQNCIEALTKLTILPFDESAARLFENLKRRRLRYGTMDLKIAAICLVHDGLLLTRNLSDFANIPGLRVENWLD